MRRALQQLAQTRINYEPSFRSSTLAMSLDVPRRKVFEFCAVCRPRSYVILNGLLNEVYAVSVSTCIQNIATFLWHGPSACPVLLHKGDPPRSLKHPKYASRGYPCIGQPRSTMSIAHNSTPYKCTAAQAGWHAFPTAR